MNNNALSPLHQYNLHYNFQNYNKESQKVKYKDTVLNCHRLSQTNTNKERHIYTHFPVITTVHMRISMSRVTLHLCSHTLVTAASKALRRVVS